MAVSIAIIHKELKQNGNVKDDKYHINSIQQILESNHFQRQVYIDYHVNYTNKDTQTCPNSFRVVFKGHLLNLFIL
jgi:hypothetical protein